jgi:hypothetical protein
LFRLGDVELLEGELDRGDIEDVWLTAGDGEMETGVLLQLPLL